MNLNYRNVKISRDMIDEIFKDLHSPSMLIGTIRWNKETSFRLRNNLEPVLKQMGIDYQSVTIGFNFKTRIATLRVHMVPDESGYSTDFLKNQEKLV